MQVSKAFTRLDADRSGGIGKAEFKLFLSHFGISLSREGLTVLFDKFDPDGSGEACQQSDLHTDMPESHHQLLPSTLINP